MARSPDKDEKERRLAEALRRNLRRRKAVRPAAPADGEERQSD